MIVKRYAFTLLLGIFVLALNGCSSKGYVVPTGQKFVLPPPEGKAQIVFIRNAWSGRAITSPIVEVTDNNIKPVTILEGKQKTAYIVEPGLHEFVIMHETSDFFQADVAANKTYYFIVTPRMGIWKQRFTPNAVKKTGGNFQLDSEEFTKMRDSVGLSTNLPALKLWFGSHQESIFEKVNSARAEWPSESQETRDAQSVQPEDGLQIYIK